MPIQIDILENRVLGREYRRGLAEGEREEGLAILRRLLLRRFGSIPAWAEERLAGKTTDELEELSVRIFDAGSIEELFH